MPLALLALCTNVHAIFASTKKSVEFFDFESIKNDFFTQSTFNRSSDEQIDQKIESCIGELNAIKSGLMNSELWAMKRKYK